MWLGAAFRTNVVGCQRNFFDIIKILDPLHSRGVRILNNFGLG